MTTKTNKSSDVAVTEKPEQLCGMAYVENCERWSLLHILTSALAEADRVARKLDAYGEPEKSDAEFAVTLDEVHKCVNVAHEYLKALQLLVLGRLRPSDDSFRSVSDDGDELPF